MNYRSLHSTMLALAAAGAIGASFAQAPAPGSTLPPNLVAEPTASSSVTEGPNADLGKALVEAINADTSLKGSKVTVQPHPDGKVTLTGVTESRAQARRIGQIAAQMAEVENVTNAIRDSEMTVEQQPQSPAPANPADTAQQQPG